jgi:hypothetical protein
MAPAFAFSSPSAGQLDEFLINNDAVGVDIKTSESTPGTDDSTVVSTGYFKKLLLVFLQETFSFLHQYLSHC